MNTSEPTPSQHEINAALVAHRSAIQRWLNASREDRPVLWRDVEAAWRDIRALRINTQAARVAAMVIHSSGKIRSAT